MKQTKQDPGPSKYDVRCNHFCKIKSIAKITGRVRQIKMMRSFGWRYKRKKALHQCRLSLWVDGFNAFCFEMMLGSSNGLASNFFDPTNVMGAQRFWDRFR